MKDMLFAVVGLIGAVIAIYFIWSFLQPPQKGQAVSYVPLIIGVIGAIVAVICGGLFLSGRVNKQEEIHITE